LKNGRKKYTVEGWPKPAGEWPKIDKGDDWSEEQVWVVRPATTKTNPEKENQKINTAPLLSQLVAKILDRLYCELFYYAISTRPALLKIRMKIKWAIYTRRPYLGELKQTIKNLPKQIALSGKEKA